MFFALLTLNKKNPLAHAPRHEFLAENMGISEGTVDFMGFWPGVPSVNLT
jgi:hypothetical protein